MLKDEVFKEQTLAADFKFSKKVADVFDDMVNRSVPFYAEMQRMIAELAANHALDGTNVYDLGCSTGTSFLLMDETISKDIRFVGIDYSPEMLQKCKTKLDEAEMEISQKREALDTERIQYPIHLAQRYHPYFVVQLS